MEVISMAAAAQHTRRFFLGGERDLFIPRLLPLDSHTPVFHPQSSFWQHLFLVCSLILSSHRPSSQYTSPYPTGINSFPIILVATDTMFHLSSALLALVSFLSLRPTGVSAVSLEDVFRNRTGSSTFRWLIRVSSGK